MKAVESESHGKLDEYNAEFMRFRVAHLYQIVLIIFGSAYPLFHHKFSYVLFIHTIIFVSFNKVITAQYFMWFGCLLPLCFFHLNLTGLIHQDSCLDHEERKFISFNRISAGTLTFNSSLWGLLLFVWLRYAYILEFNGENDFKLLWVISIIFHVIQVHVIMSCTRLFIMSNNYFSVDKYKNRNG
jgi:phosphatidylinositol glycan class M